MNDFEMYAGYQRSILPMQETVLPLSSKAATKGVEVKVVGKPVVHLTFMR